MEGPVFFYQRKEGPVWVVLHGILFIVFGIVLNSYHTVEQLNYRSTTNLNS